MQEENHNLNIFKVQLPPSFFNAQAKNNKESLRVNFIEVVTQ